MSVLFVRSGGGGGSQHLLRYTRIHSSMPSLGTPSTAVMPPNSSIAKKHTPRLLAPENFSSGFTAEARTPEAPSPLRRRPPAHLALPSKQGVLYVLRLVILVWSCNKTAFLLYIGHEGVDAVIVSSELWNLYTIQQFRLLPYHITYCCSVLSVDGRGTSHHCGYPLVQNGLSKRRW